MKNYTTLVETDKKAQKEMDDSFQEKKLHIEEIKERLRGLIEID